MSRICIVGSSGFIGRNLVKKLSEEKDKQVVCFYNTRPLDITADNISSCQVDIMDEDSLQENIPAHSLVIHLASQISFKKKDIASMYSVNVEGTRNVVQACLKKGVERLVYVGAAAVYGTYTRPILINENSPFRKDKTNPYAYTKVLAEEEIRKGEKHGLDVVVLHPSTVYGEGDYTLNSGALISYINKSNFVICPPGGTSAVGMRDLMRAIHLALYKARRGSNYIISAYNFTYQELFNKISVVLQKTPRIFVLPPASVLPLKYAALIAENISSFMTSSALMEESFRFKFFDSSLARSDLGWNPQYIFEEVLQNAIKFYRDNNLL